MSESEVVERPHWAWWVAILGGMALTGALAISDAASWGWQTLLLGFASLGLLEGRVPRSTGATAPDSPSGVPRA